MHANNITIFSLGLVLCCQLSAGIRDIFTTSSEALEWDQWHPPKSAPKKITRELAQLPDDVQTYIAQKLLQSAPHGYQQRTWPAQLKYLSHDDRVTAIAWSPDGKMIATGSSDKTIKVWEVETGNLIAALTGYKDEIWSLSWSSKGKLASSSLAETIKIWDTTTWHNTQTIPGTECRNLTCISWSPDGRCFAKASDLITIEEAKSGKKIVTLAPSIKQSSRFTSVAFSPDNKLFAAVGGHCTTIWNIENSESIKEVATFKEDRGDEFDYRSALITWSPDSTQLATGSLNGLVTIRDIASQAKIILRGHKGSISSVDWSSNGKWLASSSGHPDGNVIIWNTVTWQAHHIFKNRSNDYVWCLKWSPDGTQLACAEELNNATLLKPVEPLFTPEEFQKVSLKQALFLMLLYCKKPTLACGTKFTIASLNTDTKAGNDFAQKIFKSFSEETQKRIKERYLKTEEVAQPPKTLGRRKFAELS